MAWCCPGLHVTIRWQKINSHSGIIWQTLMSLLFCLNHVKLPIYLGGGGELPASIEFGQNFWKKSEYFQHMFEKKIRFFKGSTVWYLKMILALKTTQNRKTTPKKKKKKKPLTKNWPISKLPWKVHPFTIIYLIWITHHFLLFILMGK